MFWVESRQMTFFTHVLKVYINFQRKTNFQKNHKNQQHYIFYEIHITVYIQIEYEFFKRLYGIERVWLID